MARYFFDICDGQRRSIDSEGVDFDTRETMWQDIYRAAGTFISERTRLDHPWIMQIYDAERTLITTLVFEEKSAGDPLSDGTRKRIGSVEPDSAVSATTDKAVPSR